MSTAVGAATGLDLVPNNLEVLNGTSFSKAGTNIKEEEKVWEMYIYIYSNT